ncbi:MAG TPA: YtxH domain-containing protein [Ktedonobacteraceae bacterium]|nr:YtxH domain-containing protein [Ktedonobacteraceae bacterium]
MKFTIGLLVGFGLGVAAGLLLAPQSGEDTRSQISEQGIMLRDRSLGVSSDLRARANDALVQGREMYQRTKDELGSMYTRAKSGEM